MSAICSKRGSVSLVNDMEYRITDSSYLDMLPTLNKEASGDLVGLKEFSVRPALGSICQLITNSGLQIYILAESGWVTI